MKQIIPGGHYTYDSSAKKIWLSYEYYGLTIENIFRIKNLSRNIDLYSAERPLYQISPAEIITVENGCIALPATSAGGEDADKIQIMLRTPISPPSCGYVNYTFFPINFFDMNYFNPVGGL